jgi:outer membrane protein assembly factor BamB
MGSLPDDTTNQWTSKTTGVADELEGSVLSFEQLTPTDEFANVHAHVNEAVAIIRQTLRDVENALSSENVQILGGTAPQELRRARRILLQAAMERDYIIQQIPPANRAVVQWRAPQAVWVGPIAAEGLVYFTTSDGQMHALEVASGHERWTTPVSVIQEARLTAGGGKVVLASQSGETVLDAATGEAASAEPTPVAANDLAYSDCLKARDATTGEAVWDISLGGDDLSEPACEIKLISNNILYIIGTPGSIQGKIFAVDGETGQVKWSSDIVGPAPLAVPIVEDETTLYVLPESGILNALDKATGALRWSYLLENEETFGEPEFSLARGSHVVLLGSTTNRYFYGLDPLNGIPTWKFTGPLSAPSSLALADGQLFAGTEDGVVALREPREVGQPLVDTATVLDATCGKVEDTSESPGVLESITLSSDGEPIGTSILPDEDLALNFLIRYGKEDDPPMISFYHNGSELRDVRQSTSALLGPHGMSYWTIVEAPHQPGSYKVEVNYQNQTKSISWEVTEADPQPRYEGRVVSIITSNREDGEAMTIFAPDDSVYVIVKIEGVIKGESYRIVSDLQGFLSLAIPQTFTESGAVTVIDRYEPYQPGTYETHVFYGEQELTHVWEVR